MKVVVTGGSGRLGRSVVRGLADAGHDVVVLDRDLDPALPARSIALDLSDREATAAAVAAAAPDAVVHLAAIAVPFSAPEHQLLATNTGLAMSVLDAVISCRCPRLLVASSPTVTGYGAPCGWAPSYLPIDEDHPVEPWNAYALSKATLEGMVAMAARRYGDTLRTGAFRPCYVISPEEWDGAPTQQGHTVRERLDDPALSAVALFNYVDARDAADFVLAWLAHDDAPNGGTYIVGAADSLVREPVGQALARLVPTAAAAANALADQAPVFSSERAERELGWRATRTWRHELAEPSHGIAPDRKGSHA
ncbi:MAG: NAD-dependent epimerase/dehydratase family protein [Demequina sp.]